MSDRPDERVLVPVDGSEQSRTALEYALERFDDVVVVHVIDPTDAITGAPVPESGGGEWFRAAEGTAEDILEAARETASEHGVAVETEYRVGSPSGTIVEFAEECDADHVVMGSHGRDGVTRVLLGSVAETVVRRAPTPVTVIR